MKGRVHNMRRMWLSKRAEESDETPEASNYAVYYAIAIVIISLYAVFLVIATSAYQVETTSILGNLESAVMEYRILNSPECFVYQDEVTKRIFPHTIELDKFTKENVERCIGPMSKICFKSDLWVGSSLIISLQSTNYVAPKEIEVSMWPIIVKGRSEEKTGIMTLSTSNLCS